MLARLSASWCICVVNCCEPVFSMWQILSDMLTLGCPYTCHSIRISSKASDRVPQVHVCGFCTCKQSQKKLRCLRFYSPSALAAVSTGGVSLFWCKPSTRIH